MKFIYTIAILLLTGLVSAQDGAAIDRLSAKIMKTLKATDSTKYKDFKAIFITMEEVVAITDNMTLPEEQKKEVRAKINAEYLEEQCSKEFKSMIFKGEQMGINWASIEYEEFLYRLRFRNGLKELKGDIYFRDGDKHYEMHLQAAYLDGEYKLLELEDLDPSYLLHGYPEEMMEELMEEPYPVVAAPSIKEIPADEEIEVAVPEPDLEEFEAMDQPDEEAQEIAEVEPQFPGGEIEMQKWIAKNVHYPQEALAEGISGTVYIRFVVEKNGTLTNYEILRSPHEALEEEAVRLVRKMPKWEPGTKGGKKVRVWYTLPVRFVME